MFQSSFEKNLSLEMILLVGQRIGDLRYIVFENVLLVQNT